jgi:Ca-activated chloride channel family protein
MEQIRSNGETKEVRDEIVDLGTRYGIVTPYTSYLATDGSERQIRDLPMEARNGLGMNNKKPAPMSTANRSTGGGYVTDSAVSGEQAVAASKDRKVKKEAEKVTNEDDEILKAGNVQKIGVKTFYLENDVWIDGEYKEESKLQEIKLKFASNEFFDLINKEKDLAQYFSLGEQVVVVWKGKVYRISK